MDALGWCPDQKSYSRSHFFCDQRFSRLGPLCAAVVRLSGGWVVSSAHRPFPSFLRSVFSCVRLTVAVSLQGVYLYLSVAHCHDLLKILSETCGYEYHCRVVNNVYINYLVKVDI